MSECGNKNRPGCGRDITWGILPDGRRVPLDTTAPVYKLGMFDRELNAYAIERVSGYKVGHHATCSQVNKFKKDQKARPTEGAARPAGRDQAAGD